MNNVMNITTESKVALELPQRICQKYRKLPRNFMPSIIIPQSDKYSDRPLNRILQRELFFCPKIFEFGGYIAMHGHGTNHTTFPLLSAHFGPNCQISTCILWREGRKRRNSACCTLQQHRPGRKKIMIPVSFKNQIREVLEKNQAFWSDFVLPFRIEKSGNSGLNGFLRFSHVVETSVQWFIISNNLKDLAFEPSMRSFCIQVRQWWQLLTVPLDHHASVALKTLLKLYLIWGIPILCIGSIIWTSGLSYTQSGSWELLFHENFSS